MTTVRATLQSMVCVGWVALLLARPSGARAVADEHRASISGGLSLADQMPGGRIALDRGLTRHLSFGGALVCLASEREPSFDTRLGENVRLRQNEAICALGPSVGAELGVATYIKAEGGVGLLGLLRSRGAWITTEDPALSVATQSPQQTWGSGFFAALTLGHRVGRAWSLQATWVTIITRPDQADSGLLVGGALHWF